MPDFTSRRRRYVSCMSLLLFVCLTATRIDPVRALPKWLAKIRPGRGQQREQQDRSASAQIPVEENEEPSVLRVSMDFFADLSWYARWLGLVATACLAALFYCLYSVGALDRPRFRVRDSVVWSSRDDAYWAKHDRTTEYLYAIVALSHDGSYGRVIQRLLPATSAAVGAAVPAVAPPLAAQRYGAPSGADSLSVALYFDDPATVRQPRWALGWLVAADTFQQAREWATKANDSAWNEPEPLVAVRLGAGRVLTARVPWRHVLTPALAPSLHWRRGFAVYTRLFPDRPSPPCAEFYVTGPHQSREWMDYVIWLEDMAHTWRDCGFE